MDCNHHSYTRFSATVGMGLALALGAVACASPGSGDPSSRSGALITRVDPASIAALESGAQILVDFREADRVLVVDQTDGAVDLGRVRLLCPNGALMVMDDWVGLQASSVADAFDAALVSVSPTPDLASASLPDPGACGRLCETCPDGVTVCFNSCDPSDSEHVEGARPAEPTAPSSDGDAPAGGRAPEPPSEPRNASPDGPGDGDPGV